MAEIKESEWWLPEYGFFGPQFYLIGDNSINGPNPECTLSLDERTEKEVKAVIKYLEPKHNDMIVDCPSGYGRHVISLALEGYRLTGIDMNLEFIRMGEEQARAFELNGRASFLNKNMLDQLPFHEKFDHAINMFSSFGFFEKDEDNRKQLENFYQMLKPNGKLMLHFDFNATRILNRKYFKGDENLSRKCKYEQKDYDLHIDETYDKKLKRLAGSWTLRGDNGPVTKSYSIRIYSHDDIRALLSDIGFSDIRFYDPNNVSFTDKSKETIIVAIK